MKNKIKLEAKIMVQICHIQFPGGGVRRATSRTEPNILPILHVYSDSVLKVRLCQGPLPPCPKKITNCANAPFPLVWKTLKLPDSPKYVVFAHWMLCCPVERGGSLTSNNSSGNYLLLGFQLARPSHSLLLLVRQSVT